MTRNAHETTPPLTTAPRGVTPAVVLINPKYPHNVAAAMRAASCWGARQVWYTGMRMQRELDKLSRIPREERMKGFREVKILHDYRPLDAFPAGAVPVAVEVRENAECLTFFDHPEHAVYVFGPEDGSIPKPVLHCCHRFLYIPTHHCLNLSQAVNLVLGHRHFYAQWTGREPVPTLREVLREDRGLARPTPTLDVVGWDGR